MKMIPVSLLLFLFCSCTTSETKKDIAHNETFPYYKTDEAWRESLPLETYKVLRKGHTEPAFSSDLNNHYKQGTYVCAGCDTPLYSGNRKYDSGSGWPSFDRAIDGKVATTTERKFGQSITEVHCNSCGGHLGHIFQDGPKETTGQRHCINGKALKFKIMDQKEQDTSKYKVQKTEEQWKKELGDTRFQILRQAGTEYPHTGQYNLHFEKGTYSCGACHAPLFKDDAKFESDCGWPSFDQAIEGAIEYKRDLTHGMIRTETLCANCGSHLGHIFDDGPTATGQRYCINSASMNFTKKE